MTETQTSARPTIFELFADVKRKVGPVGKTSRNEQQNFNFRGIDAVVNAAASALDELGVITVPMLSQYDYDGSVEVGKNRSLMGHAKVQVTYRFYGPGGDYFDAKVPGEAMDSGDKATAKAMSVAYRICLLQTLNLPTSDPDPDSQTYERSSAPSGSRTGADFDNAAPAASRNGNGHAAQDGPAVPPPLAADDPWALVIADIKTPADADDAEEQLRRSWEAGETDNQRANQVKYWIRVKAAPMRTAAQSARPQAAPAAERAGDASALAGLAAELERTTLEDVGKFRGKIGRAVAERKITPDEGAALSADAIKRKRELEEAAEAGESEAA